MSLGHFPTNYFQGLIQSELKTYINVTKYNWKWSISNVFVEIETVYIFHYIISFGLKYIVSCN